MEVALEKPKAKKKSRDKNSKSKPPNANTTLQDAITQNEVKIESSIQQIVSATDVLNDEKHQDSKTDNDDNSKSIDPNCPQNDIVEKENVDDNIQSTIAESESDKTTQHPLQMEYPNILQENSASTSSSNILSYKDSTVMSSQTINKAKCPENISIAHKQFIKPFSEQQLAGFYTNPELSTLESFSHDFTEAQLNGIAIKQHPLYELLAKYLQIRERITGNNLEVKQVRNEYSDLENGIWVVDNDTVSGRGQCQDGTTVTVTHNYQVAIFHRSVFKSLTRVLAHLRTLIYGNYTLYSFTAEDLKQQIEAYIQTVISTCALALHIDNESSASTMVSLLENEVPNSVQHLTEIRLCISVLFAYQRKMIRDQQFAKETREWLSQFIAILLRLATYQDHLFLLNHVLRCPPGVGRWAANFIQFPIGDDDIMENTVSPFSSFHINHILATLAVILMPIRNRDKFLDELQIGQSNDCTDEGLWIVIDSDGEEDEESGHSLRENDIIALFTQLPIEAVFRQLMLIEQRNFENRFDVQKITHQHMLKLFAFSTTFLNIITVGLNTYNQFKYNQFCKRLSRLIRHIVQYNTDLWEIYRQFLLASEGKQIDFDRAMLERIQVEYDSFICRAIYQLYQCQKLGAWQFLAVVPYGLISSGTVWKIYRFLYDGNWNLLFDCEQNQYTWNILETSTRIQFEDKLLVMADDECYYLLHTFSNMAMARPDSEMDFIEMVVSDLLQIGFISRATQDQCSKASRNLIAQLTSKYPQLLSRILRDIRDNIHQVDDLALYLYEELPLTIWNLTSQDFELISSLLANSAINSIESKLARIILSRLNWMNIPYQIQCSVAILVLKAAEQDANYNKWAWQMVSRLKLHISDRKVSWAQHKVLDPDHYDTILHGLHNQQPLASFLTLLMTSWGHLIPLICNEGLNQLQLLQVQYQKYDAVLCALNLIVPLFLNCQEYWINSEKMHSILLGIVNAERGYVTMTKNLILTPPSSLLQQFGNMIEAQIVHFTQYDLDSPRCLTRLWLNSLVSVPNWNRDIGILYLLDVIVRTVFFYSDTMDVVVGTFSDLLQCSTNEEPGGISYLFKWVLKSNSGASLISGSLANFTWLAYVIIEIEFQEREKKSGLWRELQIQLHRQKGKINVDAAIKDAAHTMKVPSFTSTYLCIYRWAQQAMDTQLDHPLLPLLYQRFFLLYLSRPLNPATSSRPDSDRKSTGYKFFDGLVNFAFFKRLKKRLQETFDYYQMKLYEIDSNTNGIRENRTVIENYHSIFRAFTLWLEEPRIQNDSFVLETLPPQYLPQILTTAVQGIETPWYGYVDYDRLKSEQMERTTLWKMFSSRTKPNYNAPRHSPKKLSVNVEGEDPIERILNRLKTYEIPKPPPTQPSSSSLKNATQSLKFPLDFTNKTDCFKALSSNFRIFEQFAHNHTLKLAENNALDNSYLEMVPQLYHSLPMKITKKVPCKGRNDAVLCSGAAVIYLEMSEARINERIEHQIQVNRNAYKGLIEQALQNPAVVFCNASVSLQMTIRQLQNHMKLYAELNEIGAELFYMILVKINDEILAYPPTKFLFATCLEKLGQVHICGVEHEMPRLLEQILDEPKLSDYLGPHFLPINIGTHNLLLMYSKICKKLENPEVAYGLLSKFDITNWLQTKNPKLSARTTFINSVIDALITLGYEPAIEMEMLHGILRKHLLEIFRHQFPEHYGEILIQLLKVSTSGTHNSHYSGPLLSLTVWIDILNFLSQPVVFNPKISLRDQYRQYAQHQNLLHHQELLETAELLSRHFTQERLQYGIYGVYPKCREYIDVLMVLLGMNGHALVVSMIHAHQGLLGDKLVEKIWPRLTSIFSPWIVPYSMLNPAINYPSMQNASNDEFSVLLPWLPADGVLAQKIISAFFESISFVITTLPASNIVFSHIWQWYVNDFCHGTVKDYILGPIHSSFLNLPWKQFWPTMSDLEQMLRVVDQYLPETHGFLGLIFMHIQWMAWLKTYDTFPIHIKNHVYQCFIVLMVKLSNEPKVKHNSEAMCNLVENAKNLDWTSVVDVPTFQHVIDWYVMSCNGEVLFQTDNTSLDFKIFHFLKTVAGYYNVTATPSIGIQSKRLIFVKGFCKILSVYSCSHKASLQLKQKDLSALITKLLNHLENVIHIEEEWKLILQELLGLMNITTVQAIALECFQKWIQHKMGDTIQIKALLAVLGMSNISVDLIADLLELTMMSYFENNICRNFEPTWTEVILLVQTLSNRQKQIEMAMVNRSAVLSLTAFVTQRIQNIDDSTTVEIEVLLNQTIDWLPLIKTEDSVAEGKVVLLWLCILKLAEVLVERDENSTGVILHKFAKVLLQLSEDKSGLRWGRGLLNAIGIAKYDSVSLRFLSRSLGAYILAQLPEMKGKPHLVRHVANAPSRVGQLGGNIECSKVLMSLDFGQNQGKIKECEAIVLSQIQAAENSLHNADRFLLNILKHFYIKPYLRKLF